MRPAVIAIDGPASSGKSTIGHALADYLGYAMLDSGLVYRLIARETLSAGISDPSDAEITQIAQATLKELLIQENSYGAQLIFRGQRLAELELHTEAISSFVPIIARIPDVRPLVRQVQRRVIASGAAIVAGRDIGTVVAPDADLKLYLDVSLQERVARRQWAPDQHASPSSAAIRRAIVDRDQMDQQRSISPLAVSADAVVICTDKLTVEETLDIIKQMFDLREHAETVGTFGNSPADQQSNSAIHNNGAGLGRQSEPTDDDAFKVRPSRRSTQFVVGGYAVQSGRVLLMWHTGLGRWVPPGGRIAMQHGEYPHEAVIREVKAECGLNIEVDFTPAEEAVNDIASPVPSPVAMQEIRLASGEYYLDMVYFCKAVSGEVTLDYRQARSYHWFDEDDLRRFPLMPHVQKFALRALRSVQVAEDDTRVSTGTASRGRL